MRKSEARVMRVLQNFYLIKESLASFMHVIPKNLLPAQTCWEGFQYKLGGFKSKDLSQTRTSHRTSMTMRIFELQERRD
ncbi:hypothetical protein MRB53_027147 [Persea americana]|uniref:Uncharacterized protein n=1 Tax=Persea americana TaxID=3435 RepID=A0ACC2LK85_PERAE|nr:hypothetical protein MRB53_027147 [Persea americana]